MTYVRRRKKKQHYKKQKGGTIASIFTALAPLAVDLISKIDKKMCRDRIVMVRCTTPKRVTLPNGRTFTARFKHATRRDLPANVCLQRPYKQRAAPKGKRRRQPRQGGRGIQKRIWQTV